MSRRKRPFIKPAHVIGLLILILFIFVYDTFLTPILVAIGSDAEFLRSLLHFLVTLLAVVIGAFVDRTFLLKDLDNVVSEELRDAKDSIVTDIREEVIPMSSAFGLYSIQDGLNVRTLFQSLERDDRIDIMFTFHPAFEEYLPYLAKRVTDDGVRARLLFGDPGSDIVRRRFSYITEASGGIVWPHDMMGKLKTFFENTVYKIINETREFKTGELLQVKTFSRLPDIPLIIVRSGNVQSPIKIKYAYQGFYLKRPALDLPFVVWRDNSDNSKVREPLAQLLLQYFEVRWANAVDLDYVDRVDQDMTQFDSDGDD